MSTPRVEPPRVLVAGLGNIFLGDDAFGVEVVKRLSERHLATDVHLVDAGTRIVHLAYELCEQRCDYLILIDAVSKGGAPGTLYVLEPDAGHIAESPQSADGHSVAPHDVLALVRQLGGHLPRVLIVGCEPSQVGPDAGLTPPVEAAVDEAAKLVVRLIAAATTTPVEAAS